MLPEFKWVFKPPGPDKLKSNFKRNPDLAKHYREIRCQYRGWLLELSGLKVGGQLLYPYGNDLWPVLRTIILRRDTWLIDHMANPRNAEKMEPGLTHERICEVFARNIVAGEPALDRKKACA